jgi:hypothetical protein
MSLLSFSFRGALPGIAEAIDLGMDAIDPEESSRVTAMADSAKSPLLTRQHGLDKFSTLRGLQPGDLFDNGNPIRPSPDDALEPGGPARRPPEQKRADGENSLRDRDDDPWLESIFSGRERILSQTE